MNFKNRIWELMEYHEEDHGLSKFFDFFFNGDDYNILNLNNSRN